MSWQTQWVGKAVATMRASWCRLVAMGRCLAVERAGNTAIEYGVTLAGIALSASGVTAALGVDLTATFDGLQLELCKQFYSVCVVP